MISFKVALAGAEENHQVHRCKAEGNQGEFELRHHLDYLASYQHHHCHCHGRHVHLRYHFHPGGNKQVDKCTAILEAASVKVNTCILSQGMKSGENF